MIPGGALQVPAPEAQRPSLGELQAQYAAYRRRQARGLIRLLPRTAVRPLYRRALREGFSAIASADPLAALLGYCERVLPLPPFDVWSEDVRRHPTAHLYDLDDAAEAPTLDTPATVEARSFTHGGSCWVAQLRLFRDDVRWGGYVDFEEANTRTVHRTAVIFRETDPVEVRERFLDLGADALQAFLRSATP